MPIRHCTGGADESPAPMRVHQIRRQTTNIKLSILSAGHLETKQRSNQNIQAGLSIMTLFYSDIIINQIGFEIRGPP